MPPRPAQSSTLLPFSPCSGEGLKVRGILGGQQRLDLLSAWVSGFLRRLAPTTACRLLLGIVALSTAAKLFNAWHYWGFGFGDDVEIHEMTFSRLFGLDWPIWNVRTAVFPMVFVYPIQALLSNWGVAEPRLLVFAGRLVPIVFSAVAIWLTYRLALGHSRSPGLALVAGTVLAAGKLFGSLGSTELPGTVGATLVLAAALLLQSGGWT